MEDRLTLVNLHYSDGNSNNNVDTVTSNISSTSAIISAFLTNLGDYLINQLGIMYLKIEKDKPSISSDAIKSYVDKVSKVALIDPAELDKLLTGQLDFAASKTLLEKISIAAGGDGILNPGLLEGLNNLIADSDNRDMIRYEFLDKDKSIVFEIDIVRNSNTLITESITFSNPQHNVSISKIIDMLYRLDDKDLPKLINLSLKFDLINYKELPKDAKVYTSNDNAVWKKAFFSHYSDNKYYVFADGCNSWTTDKVEEVKYIKVVESWL